MNKRERVRAALAGEPVDRVPASFWFHFPRAQARGDASVQAHLDYYRESDVDFLKIMNEHPYQPNVPILKPSDWRKVRPAPISSPFYQYQLDEVKQIVDGLQGETEAIVTLFGPFSSGNHASNSLVTEHMQADPDAVSQGLGAIAESLAEFAVACVEAGAAGVYYSAQGGEEERFSEDEFLQYIKPHDLTILEAIQDTGDFHLLHICKANVRLGLYADYPSHAVNWAVTKNTLSIPDGQKLFKRTVLGGLDDRGIVVDGAPDEIQATVRALIAKVGTHGFMVGADCTLPTDIDVAHIRAAVEATATDKMGEG